MIHILIADPDSAMRKALALLLRRRLETHGIVEIEDLETLIRSLAQATPDLLLLDWRLRGTPIPETCALLHRAYPQLRIVLLSVDANDAAVAREAGADFVHKGASPAELIATLLPLLRKDQQAT